MRLIKSQIWDDFIWITAIKLKLCDNRSMKSKLACIYCSRVWCYVISLFQQLFSYIAHSLFIDQKNWMKRDQTNINSSLLCVEIFYECLSRARWIYMCTNNCSMVLEIIQKYFFKNFGNFLRHQGCAFLMTRLRFVEIKFWKYFENILLRCHRKHVMKKRVSSNESTSADINFSLRRFAPYIQLSFNSHC